MEEQDRARDTSVEISAGVRVRRCKHGAFMYFPHDYFIGGALERYGEYSEIELQFLLGFINPGDVVVEVGANIGTHTVPLARAVGDTGRVYAFEAQRVIYQMLCGNLAFNQLWNGYTLHGAVGAERGAVSVPAVDYSRVGNFGAVQMQEMGQPGEIIPRLPLDAGGNYKPKLVKIDVEGMEIEVLLGARRLISTARPILYIENDRPSKCAELIQTVAAFDYDMHWHVPPLFNPNNAYGVEHDEYQRIVSVNMICTPSEWHQAFLGLKPVESARSIPPGFERYAEWTGATTAAVQ